MYFNEMNRPTARKIPVRGVNHNSKEKEIPTEPANQPDQPKPANRDVTARPAAANETDWQAVAQRLQADMENYRKRQARRADDAIAAERERLLQLVLPVADNLARALDHDGRQEEPLRQGVELIHRELMRLLETEGVTRLQTVGQPFDPTLHEAVATLPVDTEPDTIVKEIEPGYKLGDKLLRPARVVVAA